VADAASPLEVEAFIGEVRDRLEVSGAIVEWGVSRVLQTPLEGRRVQVGSNGCDYWVSVEIDWTIPANTCIA
jgi:hypothetical protein